MRMARMLGGYALVLMAGAVLAGCSFLRNDAEPDRIYALYPASGVAVGAALPGVLQVPRPAVQPGLDTDRIALTRAGNELDFYAQSRWSGPLPQVLGALAVQSMDGAFTTVTDSGRGAGAIDYELLLTARHFEAAYGGNAVPEVHVELECLLVATSPRRVLARCDAEAREPAGENRMAPIVGAFERAVQRALEEVRVKVAAAAAAQVRSDGAR